MSKPKGIIGQIEGLKASFEAVLRKRTLYRQQINQLTAKLRERNQEIAELKRWSAAAHEEEVLLVQASDVLRRDILELGKMLDEYRLKVEDQQTEIRGLRLAVEDWREKARLLAEELHKKRNGEIGEEEKAPKVPAEQWPFLPDQPKLKWSAEGTGRHPDPDPIQILDDDGQSSKPWPGAVQCHEGRIVQP